MWNDEYLKEAATNEIITEWDKVWVKVHTVPYTTHTHTKYMLNVSFGTPRALKLINCNVSSMYSMAWIVYIEILRVQYEAYE